jgi:hypothetical protein
MISIKVDPNVSISIFRTDLKFALPKETDRAPSGPYPIRDTAIPGVTHFREIAAEVGIVSVLSGMSCNA